MLSKYNNSNDNNMIYIYKKHSQLDKKMTLNNSLKL